MSIFGDFMEVANLAKIKPTQKIPDIRYKNYIRLITFWSLAHFDMQSVCMYEILDDIRVMPRYEFISTQ